MGREGSMLSGLPVLKQEFVQAVLLQVDDAIKDALAVRELSVWTSRSSTTIVRLVGLQAAN